MTGHRHVVHVGPFGDSLCFEQAADFLDVGLDDVAGLFVYEGTPRVASVEIFAGADGYFCSSRYAGECIGVFVRDGVFHEPEVEVLARLDELECVARVVSPVEIDGEREIGAEFGADGFEDFYPLSHVPAWQHVVPAFAGKSVEVEFHGFEVVLVTRAYGFFDPRSGIGCVGRACVVVDEEFVAELAA